MNEFGRTLSVRQLYELIKANKQHIYNENIAHVTCLCEICENAVSFMQGLSLTYHQILMTLLNNSRVTLITKTV